MLPVLPSNGWVGTKATCRKNLTFIIFLHVMCLISNSLSVKQQHLYFSLFSDSYNISACPGFFVCNYCSNEILYIPSIFWYLKSRIILAVKDFHGLKQMFKELKTHNYHKYIYCFLPNGATRITYLTSSLLKIKDMYHCLPVKGPCKLHGFWQKWRIIISAQRHVS